MKLDFDLKLVSQICLLAVIAVIVVVLFSGMFKVGERNQAEQTTKIKEVIDKALVQCYALEGSFPADVHYLEKYGIVFEDQKYIYHYDVFATNYFPMVTVFTRD